MKKLLFVTSALIAQKSLGAEGSGLDRANSVPRIQSTRIDRSKVQRIYLAPGLGSIVLFPCAILEVFTGRSEDLKVQISPNDKKTLFLNLKLNSSLPTNLIARCDSSRNVFVFDVIPSKSLHQDVVEIRNFYGRPTSTDLPIKTAANSSDSHKLVLESPRLVKKGSSK